jgi:hypothetical protein
MLIQPHAISHSPHEPSVSKAPSTTRPRQSVTRALWLYRLRAPAILLVIGVLVALLGFLDRLAFGAPPSSKPIRYRITGWSPDGCFLATPVTPHDISTPPEPAKRIYPLHMTHRGPSSIPDWLGSKEVLIRREPSSNPPKDGILAHSISDADQGYDLMARLIIQGWLVPLPDQKLNNRERAFVQQGKWNKRAAWSKKSRSKD